LKAKPPAKRTNTRTSSKKIRRSKKDSTVKEFPILSIHSELDAVLGQIKNLDSEVIVTIDRIKKKGLLHLLMSSKGDNKNLLQMVTDANAIDDEKKKKKCEIIRKILDSDLDINLEEYIRYVVQQDDVVAMQLLESERRITNPSELFKLAIQSKEASLGVAFRLANFAFGVEWLESEFFQLLTTSFAEKGTLTGFARIFVSFDKPNAMRMALLIARKDVNNKVLECGENYKCLLNQISLDIDSHFLISGILLSACQWRFQFIAKVLGAIKGSKFESLQKLSDADKNVPANSGLLHNKAHELSGIMKDLIGKASSNDLKAKISGSLALGRIQVLSLYFEYSMSVIKQSGRKLTQGHLQKTANALVEILKQVQGSLKTTHAKESLEYAALASSVSEWLEKQFIPQLSQSGKKERRHSSPNLSKRRKTPRRRSLQKLSQFFGMPFEGSEPGIKEEDKSESPSKLSKKK